jgi:two-component system sensor histidine kinase YesM
VRLSTIFVILEKLYNKLIHHGKGEEEMLQAIKSSLQWKLIILITTVIVTIITSIGTFSYLKSSQAIEADVVRFSNQILKQSNFNLARYISDDEQFFQSIAGSDEFRQWANVPATERYKLASALLLIESRFILPYFNYHPEVLTISFYNRNGNENIYRNNYINNIVLKAGYTLQGNPWLDSPKGNGGRVQQVELRTDYVDRHSQTITLPVVTYKQEFQFNGQTVYLFMDISLLHVQHILDEIKLGSSGVTIISDLDGRIVSSPDITQVNQLLPESFLEQMKTGKEGFFYKKDSSQVIVYQTIPGTEWQVISYVPYHDLARSISSIRNWTLIMAIIGLLVATIFVYLISKSITKKLKELRRTIRMSRLGRFDIRTEVSGIDEVGELGEAYNHLLDRIENSIQQLAETRLVQQRAILSALQSQINSHFLYNALESINSMAYLSGQGNIQSTTIALSKMLRYTSNYQETLVTLEEEVNHLKDYIHIMASMYGEDILSEVELDPSLAGAACLKAILQPFVENSIKHSYEVTGMALKIMIYTELTSDSIVKIKIVDNGIGISKEKLEQVQQALKQHRTEEDFMQLSHVGLLNVHYRLTAYYRDGQSGVSIESPTEEGVEVTIRFPYHEKKEGKP